MLAEPSTNAPKLLVMLQIWLTIAFILAIPKPILDGYAAQLENFCRRGLRLGDNAAMQVSKYFCGLLLVVAQASPAHAAARVIDMAPAGKWVLDYNATSCKLVRSFAAGGQNIIAQFNAYGRASTFELRLSGKPLRMSHSRNVGLAFGKEAPARKVKAGVGQIGQDEMPMLFMGTQGLLLPPAGSDKRVPVETSPEQEAQIDSLTLTLPGGKAYRLNTGPMAEPMAAIRTCVDDLVRSWGLDPVELSRIVTPSEPIGNIGKWFSYADYPSEMLDKEINSNVDFAMVIGRSGEVENCYLQSVTDDPAFGKLVCAKLRERAKFMPARDAAGQAVRSLYRNRVAWRVED